MNLTATYFKPWSTHVLKGYFAIRKKSLEGRWRYYSQDIYIIWKQCACGHYQETELSQDIARIPRKVKIDSFKIPDPLSIKPA